MVDRSCLHLAIVIGVAASSMLPVTVEIASAADKVPKIAIEANKEPKVTEPPVVYDKIKGQEPRNCWSINPTHAAHRPEEERYGRIYLYSVSIEDKPADWALAWGYEERDPKTASLYACKKERRPHWLDKENFALFHFQNILNALGRKPDLRGACFRKADLRGAILREVDLRGANFHKADLTGAVLRGADLRGAVLDCANLEGADLREAKLEDANLSSANLKDAVLAEASVFGTLFETRAMPHPGGLEDIQGLADLRYEKSEHGIALLRNLARTHGLGNQARELTYALHHQRLVHLEQCNGNPECADVGSFLELHTKRVFFEWPVAWGLAPWRPFWLLLAQIPLFMVLYWMISAGHRSSLVRVDDDGGTRLVSCDWRYALAFSLISNFRIGWRDINIGEWIVHMWPTPFTLQAHGWLRPVSMIQSILGLYLIALGVLVFFDQLFQ